jgi:ABC-type Mn2+/Zn2+ transport system ATPase subunit
LGETSFDSYEERDKYLRNDLQVPTPRRHDGPAIFYSDFLAAMEVFERPDYALITPNPLDYLPFDRVRLVLNAAFRVSARRDDDDLQQVIEKFELGALLQRQIYTLSGGETLRVAMAKCVLESHSLDKLNLAAPWGVLSEESSKYLDRLIEAFSQPNKSYDVLSLNGDKSVESEEPNESQQSSGLPFGISIRSVEIALSDSTKNNSRAVAHVVDFETTTLLSPCLISGPNGHGKSLIAKTLAGAIAYTGSATITGRPLGRVRLIFQDVSNQALLTSASLDWALERNPVANHLNTLLLMNITRELQKSGQAVGEERTLLRTKVAMIAMRIAERPTGLVLDEPDWGLTRTQALALFYSVANLCEQEQVPLLVISHRRWFDKLLRSRLRIALVDDHGRDDGAMRISISEVT